MVSRRVPCGLLIQDCLAKGKPGASGAPRPHLCRSRAHRDDPLYQRLLLSRPWRPAACLVVCLFKIAMQRKSPGHRTPHGRIETPTCLDSTQRKLAEENETLASRYLRQKCLCWNDDWFVLMETVGVHVFFFEHNLKGVLGLGGVLEVVKIFGQFL